MSLSVILIHNDPNEQLTFIQYVSSVHCFLYFYSFFSRDYAVFICFKNDEHIEE